MQPELPPAVAAITDDVVAALGPSVGLSYAPDRLAAIAQRLREMHMMAMELDPLDVAGDEPAPRFDASWSGSDES